MVFLKKLFAARTPSREAAPAPPEEQPGRNDPCWCGSGQKYKKCHLAADQEYFARQRSAQDCTPAFG